MKRFYAAVTVFAEEGGYGVRLDARPLRTPRRAPLLLPCAALAEGVAEEWRAQGETIAPRAMPLTGLANAAIDQVAPDRAGFARGLAGYAEADLLCYRAEGPASLVAREAAAWDPLLDWACARYDVRFTRTAGIVHAPQPPETVARLGEAVAGRGPFALAGLSPLVTLGGSLVAALAVAEGAVAAEDAFAATHLDEYWQAERWGEDAEAAEARAARKRDFLTAARFLALLGPERPE